MRIEQVLARFLAKRAVKALPEKIQTAGDGEIVFQRPDLLLETGQIAEFPFQLLLLRLEPFQLGQQESLSPSAVSSFFWVAWICASRLVMAICRVAGFLVQIGFLGFQLRDLLVLLINLGGGEGDGVGLLLGVHIRLDKAGFLGGKVGRHGGQFIGVLKLGGRQVGLERRADGAFFGELLLEIADFIGIGMDCLVQLLFLDGVRLVLHPQNDAEARAGQDRENNGQV